MQQPRERRTVRVGHAEAVEGNRLVRGQQPQYHVLAVPRGRDGRHAQLDVAFVQAPLDLAVLGFAPLGDVELGEHLDARRNGALVPRRDAQVGITAAVLAEAHDGLAAGGAGFDVDVRRAGPIGVRDDPVDETDHGVVVRLRLDGHPVRGRRTALVAAVPGFLGRQLVEQGDPRRVGRRAAADRGDQGEHVVAQRDHVGNRLPGKQPPDVLLALKVLRVVGQHFHAAVHGAQRQPTVGAQIAGIDAAEEFRCNGRGGVGLEERAAVEPTQRLPQLALAHAELGRQHRLDRLARRAGRGGRLFQLRRGQPPRGEQGVELRLPRGELVLVVQRDAERTGDFCDLLLVLRGEAGGVALVDELQHAGQRVGGIADGRGQQLAGAQPGLLVPGAVERQVGAQPAQLGVVVRVRDVHQPFGLRHETGDAAGADRQADLAQRVGIQKAGVEFVVGAVEGVQRQMLCIEQTQHGRAEGDQQLVEIRRGVNLVRDLFDPLCVRHAGVQVRDRGGLHSLRGGLHTAGVASQRAATKPPPLTPFRDGKKPCGNSVLEDPTPSSFPRKRESKAWIPACAEPAPSLNGDMTRKNCLGDRLV